MIAEATFDALVTLLVEAGAVPTHMLADSLDRLAQRLEREASGGTESDWMVMPAECLERAQSLTAQAAALRARP
jgi:hypothetical protein